MGFAGVWSDPDVAKPDKLSASRIYIPQGSSKKKLYMRRGLKKKTLCNIFYSGLNYALKE